MLVKKRERAKEGEDGKKSRGGGGEEKTSEKKSVETKGKMWVEVDYPTALRKYMCGREAGQKCKGAGKRKYKSILVGEGGGSSRQLVFYWGTIARGKLYRKGGRIVYRPQGEVCLCIWRRKRKGGSMKPGKEKKTGGPGERGKK